MARLPAVGVFTPNSFPTHTYIARSNDQLEQRLKDALATPGEIVSVSGPSKSGKTVLIERVIGTDDLIKITGAGIADPSEIWERVLDWMATPTSKTTTTTWSGSTKAGGGVKGELSLPFVAEGGAQLNLEGVLSAGRATAVQRGRRGIAQVVSELKGSSFVLLIDDFHYINRALQSEVAKQIKEAAAQSVKICVASVPHRADDVVRGNPELRGRVRAIDLSYWKNGDLRQIATVGFPKLNLVVDEAAITRFVEESSGSPQLMQAICLQCCRALGVKDALDAPVARTVEHSLVEKILRETASISDYSSLVRNMHSGPKIRGNPRKDFVFYDGSRGDVYRCVLLALRKDPARLNFGYPELSRRIQSVSPNETPQAASIYQACAQIAKAADDLYPEERVVEWDEDDSILDIVDPYFLFYLRWSDKLSELAFMEPSAAEG